MDWASVIGLVLAIAGIILGYTLDGGRFASLMQPAAFAIVVVGTFGATLLQSEPRAFLRGLGIGMRTENLAALIVGHRIVGVIWFCKWVVIGHP